MMKARFILFGLIALICSCKPRNEFQIVIEPGESKQDTLYIRELVTERILGKVPLKNGAAVHTFQLNEVTLGALTTSGTDGTCLTILKPGDTKIITRDSVSLTRNESVADSLVNYLWSSTNSMFSLYGELIFGRNAPDKVRLVFDSLIDARENLLHQYRTRLTEEEWGILNYQNEARAHSFLMFYGRILKQLPPDNLFFDFVNDIENENVYAKSLPNNLLYKYEIQFLREKDSIESIDSFLKFIEAHTTAKTMQDFLKAVYLKDVIESPSYWRRHVNLFTTDAIKEALEREADNGYSYLIKRASASFYSSQRGEKGFDFVATRLDGTELRLSDLEGKIVFIDTWATWCGPCVAQRPAVVALARKYKDRQDIVFLMVSVDHAVDRWKNYVTRTNENLYGIEVVIPDGMNSEFGDKYLIKAIPKYILIDKHGVIVDSNLPEPSIQLEKLIERESGKLD